MILFLVLIYGWEEAIATLRHSQTARIVSWSVPAVRLEDPDGYFVHIQGF
jgi:hypothetical protein